ncbi:MAG: exosortase/archaeosortase family protein [Thermoguttaceae bacterium]
MTDAQQKKENDGPRTSFHLPPTGLTGSGATGTMTGMRRGNAGTVVSEKIEWENAERESHIDYAFEKWRFLLLMIVMIPSLLIAYWPAVTTIVNTWYKVQDYSHGFIVIPLVIYFIWIRLDTYPGTCKTPGWLGLIPLLVSLIMRYVGSLYYMDAVEQWSMLFWILGVVWLFYGTRAFFWVLPSLSFLCFLFPLPFTFEVMLRRNLQIFAAKFAAFLLQTLGQPAVNIGTTIRLGVDEIGVEAACSGIRFMISFFAMAVGAVLLFRRPWWQNLVIFASVVPIALLVNSCRIVLTSLLIAYWSETIQPFVPEKGSIGKTADEFSGYVAIGFALLLFALMIFYLTRVFRRVNLLSAR